MKIWAVVWVWVCFLFLVACQKSVMPAQKENIPITSTIFETLKDGHNVTLWTLRNASGAQITVMDLGATILTMEVPDKKGALSDVVFGFHTAAPYLTDSPYFGAVVGRYANRIKEGKFSLDGQTYQLATNNGPNALHGGNVGFDKRVWDGERVETSDGPGVKFSLISEDGEEGYPGTVRVSATYVWTGHNQLIIDYEARSDAPTPFNVSQHSYWNLSGAQTAETVLNHNLQIFADRYLPVDQTLIPTGTLEPVKETPFDFRSAKPIGKDIDIENEQLRFGGGYDHNWVLNGDGLRKVAILTDPVSGRRMNVLTDLPGLQFYSGNFLDGTVVGKYGNAYPYRSAIALETQLFPDSPNQKGFPDSILRPGEGFKSRTVYAFDVIDADL